MGKADRVLGVLLIIGTVLTFGASSVSFLSDHLNLFGLFVAGGNLVGASFICASIWRDRL